MSQTNLNSLEATLARLLNTRLRKVIHPVDLTPIQITAVYGFFGFGALYLSDVYLPQTIQDPGFLAQLQALKGGAEILLTAGVILVLTTRSRHAIQARNDRLDNLRAERNVLHRVFRHNFRQDVNIIKGYSDLIRQEVDDAGLRENCEKVMDRIDQMEDYQKKIVKLERVLEPPTTIRRMDLAAVVRDDPVLRELQDDDEVSITVDLPEESPAIVTPFIESAFQEILMNAVEYNDTDEPTVEVRLEENSHQMVDLVVADNGPGISEYERFAIESMGEDSLTHSSGLGLWLAKLACTVSGGDLVIPADQETGGRVVLKLPEAPERTIQRQIPAISG